MLFPYVPYVLRALAALALVLHPDVSAGQEFLFYQHLYTRQDGLPTTTVHTCLRDKRGFLWVGTEKGLCRFEGGVFKLVAAPLNVQHLALDSNQTLWIGTPQGLLSLSTAQPAAASARERHTLREHGFKIGITSLLCDTRGNLWIGTERALFLAEEKVLRALQAQPQHHTYQHSQSLVSASGALSLAPRSIGGDSLSGIRQLRSDQRGIVWVEANGRVYQLQTTEHTKGALLDIRALSTTLPGSRQELTGLEYEQGVLVLERTNKNATLRIANHTSQMTTSAADVPLFANLNRLIQNLVAAHQTTIALSLSAADYAHGRVWLSIRSSSPAVSSGIYYHSLPARTLSSSPILEGSTVALYHDAEGTAFASTPKGLWSGYPTGIRFYATGLNDSIVTAIYRDSKGVLWVGTRTGINRLTGTLDAPTWKSYLHHRSSLSLQGSASSTRLQTSDVLHKTTPPSLEELHNRIFVITEDSKGRLLCGTMQGLFVYDRTKDTFTRDAALERTLNGGAVTALAADRTTGELWVYEVVKNLCVFDADGKLLRRFEGERNKHDSTGLSFEYVNTIVQDSKGSLWIGTELGLNKWQPQTKTFKKFNDSLLQGASVSWISETPRGDIMVGFGGDGFSLLQPWQGQAVNAHKTARPISNQALQDSSVLCVIADYSNHYWVMGKNSSLFRYSPEQQLFNEILSSPPSAPKLLEGGHSGVGFQESNGTIYTRYGDGFIAFEPEKIFRSQHPVNVAVFDEAAHEYFSGDTLQLRDGQSIRLTLTPLTSILPEHTYFKTLVYGKDTTWSFTKGNNLLIESLPEGRYVLTIRALGINGVWSETGYTLTLLVKPLWWNTWQFRIVGIALIAAGVVAFSSYRRKYQLQMLHEQQAKQRAEEAAKQAQEREELAQQRAEYEQKRAEYEQRRFLQERDHLLREKEFMERMAIDFQLKTLHLQLNPHFLRNAITPLYSLIAKGDNEEALQYLESYTGLMTSLIAQTRDEITSLHDELAFLNAYIELERYQSGNAFTFSLTHSVNCRVYSVGLPPMLIQPYCENAIRHGLIPLKHATPRRAGHLAVHIDCTERYIVCTIEDNGIGRTMQQTQHEEQKQAQAESHFRSSRLNHRSISTTALSERLQLLEQVYHIAAEHTIEDRFNEHGQPCGTLVTLRIPIFPLHDGE
jgi:ligand-binding sensor domain-containing protein/signal transduction histidine kinase